MLRSKSKWEIVDVEESLIEKLMKEQGTSKLISRILVRRNITSRSEVEQFLAPSLNQLYDPFLLDGMDKAVERIQRAINNKEKIYIYGDYDVDGVSSTSLLLNVFHLLDAHIDYYIPNRFTEGYGLHLDALEHLKEQGADLVITVDTGISALQESAYCKELGLDLIITDHHEPKNELPQAVAVLNPKKKTCPYPCKLLAGVGVAFKLATALLNRVPEEFLDIVALGTVADLVPLVDENRVLATYGLLKLNKRANRGLDALLEVSGIKEKVTESHVGFSLGPRINASGRLKSAHTAVRLLMTENKVEAKNIAEELDQLNRSRQALVEEMTAEAISQIESDLTIHRHFILVAQSGWNSGVVGIVASRLVEKYYRPVIVLSIDEEAEVAKGSARGIPNLNLVEALTECEDILLQYGGHAMAGGMSLKSSNISLLHQRLSQIAEDTLHPEDYVPVSLIEGSVSIGEVNEPFIEEIKSLAPFGIGNPVPHFMIQKAEIVRMQLLGDQQQHLKLLLKQDVHTLSCISFRFGERSHGVSSSASVDVIGELSINEWNGRRSPQLLVKDLAVSHFQVFDWRSNRDSFKRIKSVDPEKSCYIVSSRKGMDHHGLTDVLCWDELANIDLEKTLRPYIFFLDSPPSKGIMDGFIQHCKDTERFYFVYGDKQLDEGLMTVPSRDTFKKVYVALIRKEKLSPLQEMNAFSKYTGLDKKTLVFILKVFEELELIERKDTQLCFKRDAKKKELLESNLYTRQSEKEKVIQFFIHSSKESLYNYVYEQISLLQGEKKLELQR